MIDTTPEGPVFLLPFDPVVEGAAGKERYGRESEDSEGNSTLKLLCGRNQDQTSYE